MHEYKEKKMQRIWREESVPLEEEEEEEELMASRKREELDFECRCMNNS